MNINPYLSIIIALLSLTYCCGQNYEINQRMDEQMDYDRDFDLFILGLWTEIEFERGHLDKFDFIKEFKSKLKTEDGSILSNDFLKKPTIDNLIALYLDTRLRWNSFKNGNRKKSISEVVDLVVNNLPSENEMLLTYYNNIFGHILNTQNTIPSEGIDINFEQLGLNLIESVILFLSAMYYLGDQVNSYSEWISNHPQGLEFSKKIPTFNGKKYFEIEIPEFDDFILTHHEYFNNVSFKKSYIPKLEIAKEGYRNCIEGRGKN